MTLGALQSRKDGVGRCGQTPGQRGGGSGQPGSAWSCLTLDRKTRTRRGDREPVVFNRIVIRVRIQKESRYSLELTLKSEK
jgi:hypothetical protein